MMRRFATAGAVLLLLTSWTACTEPDDVQEVPASEEDLESVPPVGGVMPENPKTEEPLDVAEVEVILRDDSIEMADRVPATFTRFFLRNEGTVEHGFEVEGPGLETKLSTRVPPGGRATLEADLEAGTYEVHCPVADHAERGMRRELKVGGLRSPPAGPR